MKLFRYRFEGKTLPGVAVDDRHYDLSQHLADIDRAFFEQQLIDRIGALLQSGNLPEITGAIDFDAPVYRPGKIVCIGLNYRRHAAESGMAVPTEPILFFKAASSITGPFDNIVIPRNSQKTDWEVELALVIGKDARYVDVQEATDYIGGYVLHNDVSERAFQLERGGQWVKGKSCDSFAPIGPYIVTPDEIEDPHKLRLWLSLNGEMLQDGNTSDFIFDIPTVISYVSQFMTLEAGDIISTGTPQGVGLGFDPPRYLKAGDVIALGIDGIGEARQHVVAYPE
ncbi:MAG: fumarylacetoacetate hydrolase family protein [Saprospiraceae bacterium]